VTTNAQQQAPAQTQASAQPAYGAAVGGQPANGGPEQATFGGNAQVGGTPGQFGVPTEAVGSGGSTAYGTKSPFDSSGQSNYSKIKAEQDAKADTLFHKNRFAMGTFIFVAINVVVALSTGLFFIGIFPAYLAYESFSKGEQLAPLAVGAAVIGLVVSIATFNS
jgi:hypothetical protein